MQNLPRVFRRVHFLVTVLIGLPLVVWTVTGFAFTCFDFQSVRGARDRAPPEELDAANLEFAGAIARARGRRPGGHIAQVHARPMLGHTVYEVEFAPPDDPVLVDGPSGEARDGITAEEARAIARAGFRGEVHAGDARLITSEKEAPGIREAAYRVSLDDANHTEVFVTQRTGEILSWRNDSWRSFDRLWSLHVFGFIDRRSPAHWPLRIAGGLAAIAALSGLALLLVSSRRRPKRHAASNFETI